VERAGTFSGRQVVDRLNPWMCELVVRQEMLFVSTSDGRGECDWVAGDLLGAAGDRGAR
jgi:hypothetical protein